MCVLENCLESYAFSDTLNQCPTEYSISSSYCQKRKFQKRFGFVRETAEFSAQTEIGSTFSVKHCHRVVLHFQIMLLLINDLNRTVRCEIFNKILQFGFVHNYNSLSKNLTMRKHELFHTCATVFRFGKQQLQFKGKSMTDSFVRILTASFQFGYIFIENTNN